MFMNWWMVKLKSHTWHTCFWTKGKLLHFQRSQILSQSLISHLNEALTVPSQMQPCCSTLKSWLNASQCNVTLVRFCIWNCFLMMNDVHWLHLCQCCLQLMITICILASTVHHWALTVPAEAPVIFGSGTALFSSSSCIEAIVSQGWSLHVTLKAHPLILHHLKISQMSTSPYDVKCN